MLDNFLNLYHTYGVTSITVSSVLIATGFIVGFINTLAGMATALTYALFMAMGMPINIANGTTRVGILAQFAVSSAIFKREGYLDVKLSWKIAIPVAIGSFAGAELVAILNTSVIEVTMGVLLPIMAVFLLFFNKAKRMAEGLFGSNMNNWKFFIFILIGLYGGFTHSGVGILIIFGTMVLMSTDIMKANAVKQFAVLVYTPLALGVFMWHNQINWPVAFVYAIGNVAGAIVASKVAIKWGTKFINWCVATAVFGISFWLIYKQFV